MGNFYRQTKNSGLDVPKPRGEYTDFAVQRDGALLIADIDGNWRRPVNLTYLQPFIKEFTEKDWLLNSDSYVLEIPEAEHQRTKYSVVTAVFKKISNNNYLQMNSGTFKTISEEARYSDIAIEKTLEANFTIRSTQNFEGILYIDRVYPQATYPNSVNADIWIGTLAEYNNMSFHDPDVIYLISD